MSEPNGSAVGTGMERTHSHSEDNEPELFDADERDPVMPPDEAEPETNPMTVRERVQRWASDLIDPSRRNSSLHYKKTQKSTVEIVAPQGNALLERLKESVITVYTPPTPDKTPNPEGEAFGKVGHSPEELQARALADGQLISHIEHPRDLLRAFHNIDRAYRADHNDRGLHTLYISYGLLHWAEQEQPDQPPKKYRSPIVYIPCTLAWNGRSKVPKLKRTDGDPVVNPSLLVKLSQDFNETAAVAALPELDEDLALAPIMAAFETLAARHPGWSVSNHAAIKRCTFSKEPIWVDLTQNVDTVVESNLVNMLANSEYRLPVVSDESPTPETIDSLDPPEDALLILNADASQRAAIKAAKQGRSFVMDGPPGTGKSQTISNMIAALMAAGKSVLFVSEKAAALDAVAKNIHQVGLGDFLFEVHSHKTSRKQVAQTLGKGLSREAEPMRALSASELERARSHRNALNTHAEAMNTVREPLGQTVFNVLGQIGDANQPTLPFPEQPSPSRNLTAADLMALNAAFKALGHVWAAEVDPNFTWRGFTRTSFSPADRTDAIERLRRILGLINQVENESNRMARDMGLPAVDSEHGAEQLASVANAISNNPGLPPVSWDITDAQTVMNALIQAEAASKAIRTHRDPLQRNYPPPPANDAASDAVIHWSAERAQTLRQRMLQPISTDPKATWIGEDPVTQIAHFADESAAVIKELNTCGSPLSRFLKPFGLGPAHIRLKRCINLLHAASEVDPTRPPYPSWCNIQMARNVDNTLSTLAPLQHRYSKAVKSTKQYFSESVFDVDIAAIAHRMSTVHTGWTKWFSSSYWSDRKMLGTHAKDGRFSPTLLDGLRYAVKADELATAIDKAEDEHNAVQLLSDRFYRKRNSRLVEAGNALELVKLGVKYGEDRFARISFIEQFCTTEPTDPALSNGIEKLLPRLRRASESITRMKPVPEAARKLTYNSLYTWLTAAHAQADALRTAIAPLNEQNATNRSFEHACADLAAIRALRNAEAELNKQGPTLTRALDNLYKGTETDWGHCRRLMEFLQNIHRLAGRVTGGTVTASFLARCKTGTTWDPAALLSTKQNLRTETGAVLKWFTETRQHAMRQELEHDFESGRTLFESLLTNIGQAEDWVTCRRRRRELQQRGYYTTLATASERSIPPNELAHELNRATLAHWIHDIFDASGGPLSPPPRFDDYADRLSTFRALDKLLPTDAVSRIQRDCLGRFPRGTVGAVQTIRRQAELHRNHLQVRELLAKTFNAAVKLRPCFMMSPLTVSQYLPPDRKFDVLIFDEASQLFVEDCIGALYRSSQLIVAGDDKQMPPTNFFNVNAAAADGDYSVEIEDYTSFLKAARARIDDEGFGEYQLNWHYRSRCETLINFNNQRFYDGRLVTFPAKGGETLGKRLVKVDGQYDRGATRTNEVEANEVIKLIKEHIQNHPDRSLGIVTMSIAQRDKISHLVDDLRAKGNPQIDAFFSKNEANRLNAFFVKSLESVQGDERDTIIMSVGYGPLKDGSFHREFGPMNNHENGWRRLNVATSRARCEFITVVSFDPRAHEATNNPSMKSLWAFLEDARRGGKSTPPAHVDPNAETESPFEDSVLEAIRELGYEATPQVGAGRYRIDFGVTLPNQPNQFVLGIECDGAMYHRSKTARDRDRTRQSVLNNMGWTIHRIWGTEWYRDRADQVARLNDAIRDAIEGHDIEYRPTRPPDLISLAPEPVAEATYPWTCAYRAYGHDEPLTGQVHATGNSTKLETLMRGILEHEQPITKKLLYSRVCQAFGVPVTTNPRQAIDGMLATILRQGTYESKQGMSGVDYIQSKSQPNSLVRVPDADLAHSKRDIVNEIPKPELNQAILRIVEDASHCPQAELMRAVSRLFGIRSIRERVQTHLTAIIDELVNRNRLLRDDDAVVSIGPNPRIGR